MIDEERHHTDRKRLGRITPRREGKRNILTRNSPRRRLYEPEAAEIAKKKTEYKEIDDGNRYSGIPDFEGVWSNGTSVEENRKELIEVLEEWLILKVKDRDTAPVVKWYR